MFFHSMATKLGPHHSLQLAGIDQRHSTSSSTPSPQPQMTPVRGLEARPPSTLPDGRRWLQKSAETFLRVSYPLQHSQADRARRRSNFQLLSQSRPHTQAPSSLSSPLTLIAIAPSRNYRSVYSIQYAQSSDIHNHPLPFLLRLRPPLIQRTTYVESPVAGSSSAWTI